MEQGPLWYVRLEGEEIRVWTLDQLDAAYRASFVDSETLVRSGPGGHWNTLGALLGNHEPPASVARTPVGIPWARVPAAGAPAAPVDLPVIVPSLRRWVLARWALVGVVAALAALFAVRPLVAHLGARSHPAPAAIAPAVASDAHSTPVPSPAPAPVTTPPATVAAVTPSPDSAGTAEKGKHARGPRRRHVAVKAK